MHFDLSEEHLMIQKAAREFAQTELKPGVIERDEHQKFPAEQIKKMGELGYYGHSGVSFGFIMREMQFIAQKGEKEYKKLTEKNN